MKKDFREGSHRVCKPDETFSNIIGLLPAFGITRIANLTGLDRLGVPVAAAIRPNAKSISVSQGKGASLIAAKVSAAMEAIEAFHAENITMPALYMSMEDLELSKNIADLNGLPRSSKKEISASHKMLWVEGVNLLNSESVWIPYDSVTTDLTLREKPRTPFIPDSNGLASGNTLMEAQIHAICESIERDALVHFWAKREEQQMLHCVRSHTIENTACREMLDSFERNSVSHKIWDATSDFGIPTFICKVIESEFRPDRSIRPAFGSGTHLDKNVALSRAITEAAQGRITFISGARDDQYRGIYKEALTRDMHEAWKAELRQEGFVNHRYTNSYIHETLEEDLELLLSRLSSCGIKQVLSVDLSRQEFGIPVVKILIPNLETVSSTDIRAAGRRLLS